MFRLRAPLSLVAVFLLIALVVAVLIGGKVVQDWNALHHGTPAGHSSGPSFQDQVALLEQRPLTLPVVSAGGSCPSFGNDNSAGFSYGSGPVYAFGSQAEPSPWGNFFSIPWYTDPNLTGPVLVRGTDLQGHPIVFSGTGAYGPVVGNDPTQPSPALHSELVLDAGHPKMRMNGYGVFNVRQGIGKDSSCAGFQVDGASFEEKFTG